MLEKQLELVQRFHHEITGLRIPDHPTMLTGDRMTRSLEMLREEVDEFDEAETAADQADALIDLIYFAHGRLLEMGIRPGPSFQLVHDANMRKVRGPNKRGDQFEAAKPLGWQPPDWWWFLGNEIKERTAHDARGHYIGLTRTEPGATLEETKAQRHNPWDNSCVPRKPKVLLLGYGRHGKDTVAEMLRDHYGLSFTSSSMFCAEKVMMPAFERETEEFLCGQHGRIREDERPKEALRYLNAHDCFEDRHNHRKFWFDEIERFNTPDKASLGKAIFAEHDIYCGLRSKKEFAAVKNSGLYDVCIWVDRSDHVPPESKESCTVEPWMADYVLDNNGTLEELRFNLDQLMGTLRLMEDIDQ